MHFQVHLLRCFAFFLLKVKVPKFSKIVEMFAYLGICTYILHTWNTKRLLEKYETSSMYVCTALQDVSKSYVGHCSGTKVTRQAYQTPDFFCPDCKSRQ